jgi:NDP-sugar pyrophosphorylase family protein
MSELTEPPAPADLTAIILAGGLGTRLKSVLPDHQKVVAPVGERPFIMRVLDQLAAAGLRRAVLCTGHRGDQVRELLGDHYESLELKYSQETEPLGTAGAARLALPLVTGPTALVMNGDSFCASDLPAFRRWHTERAAAATLLLTEVEDVGRYGQVEFADQGQVTHFVEKGAGNGRGWISAGVYLLNRAVLEAVPTGRAVSIEREVFPAWVGRGLYAWPGGGRFIDIGTPATLGEAQQFFKQAPN